MLKAMTQTDLLRACRGQGFLLPEAPGRYIQEGQRCIGAAVRHRGSLGGESRGHRGQQLRLRRPPLTVSWVCFSACLLILLAPDSCSSSGHVLNSHSKEPCMLVSTPPGRVLSGRVVCLRLPGGHVFILVQSHRLQCMGRTITARRDTGTTLSALVVQGDIVQRCWKRATGLDPDRRTGSQSDESSVRGSDGARGSLRWRHESG